MQKRHLVPALLAALFVATPVLANEEEKKDTTTTEQPAPQPADEAKAPASN